MGLPNFDDLKDYLKVETQEEDPLIQDILDGANGWVTSYFGVPLGGETRTFYGRWPRRGPRREPYEQLTVPFCPCASTADITDPVTEAVVDAADYVIDQRTGLINTVYGATFYALPYTIEIEVGWEQDPDFNRVSEPILHDAILWAATDFYRRRNPGAEYEQSGGQVSITYTRDEIPAVLRGRLESLRPKGRAW